MNVADAVRGHARQRPAHPAVVHGGRTIDYALFDRWVDAAAALLAGHGVRPGDHVGIGMGDRPEHLACLFGAARLGAVFVPVDCRWTGREKARLCGHFHVRLLLLDAEDACDGDIPIARIAENWDPPPSGAGGHALPDAAERLPLALFLSSGTTGQPKGPLLTHANMLARFRIYRDDLGLSTDDRFACTTPLYFSGSRGFAMCMLHAGGTVVLLPPPMKAGQLIEAINEQGCTGGAVVPTLIRRMLAEHPGRSPCLPFVRGLISMGAALGALERAEALERISPGLLTFYGSSEGGGVSALAPHHPAAKAESSGAILPRTEVRIVDEDFHDVESGTTGRICYRSEATATGFYNDPEQTARTFRDGWFFPGDLGRIDADRFIYITGREKDMIIRGGANIYPEDVERVLRAHPQVADVAVVGAPSAELGEEVVAYVTLSGHVDDGQLLDWCRRDLAPYMIPRRFHRMRDLPRTAFGKTDKVALRTQAASADVE